MKKIVVLGAGYGGVLTAKKLAKKLRHREVSITIIDKNPFHTLLTELHEVMAERVSEEAIKIPLKQIFAGRDVEVVMDQIIRIDRESKLLHGKEKDYPYDHLVMATGSKPSFFGIEGAKRYSFELWSYEDAIRLRDHIRHCFRKAEVEPSEEKRRELLSFYVVGAGFTGIEIVGELAEHLPILCKKYGIDPAEVSLVNVDILSRTVPIFSEDLSKKVQGRLEKMGVSFKLATSVTDVEKSRIVLRERGEDLYYPTHTVIWAAGIENADVEGTEGLALSTRSRGRIEVDPYLRALDDPNVFVVGDNLFFIPEGELVPVNQLVENCIQSSSVVAHNIAVSIVGGEGELQQYVPRFHGVIVSIGSRYAVGSFGLPERRLKLPSFIAMIVKHFCNIAYMARAMGWTRSFRYLKQEFFTIRDRRSIVGGHFSNVTPSFMMVPLRIWLGLAWIISAIHKIFDGWWNKLHLADYFLSAELWYRNIIDPGSLDALSSATQTIDARSGATVLAIESSGTIFANWNVMDSFKIYIVSGKELAGTTLADIAIRWDIPLVKDLVNNFLLKNDQTMLFLQRSMVVLELVIGVALIIGLFTFIASHLSLFLQGLLMVMTGLYFSNLWMMFASFLMIFASGQTMGLDYYVLPRLKRRWKEVPFVRKWYLYHD